MNLKPGDKAQHMCNGWFMQNGVRVVQPMNFPPDHPKLPNQPKEMKMVLQECNLWHNSMFLICCGDKCAPDATNCCATQTLSLQPDFQEQKSLVQETIEAAGHLCIFLPKFHCELNFIKFFWGAVKWYLREHCNYSYDGLQENLPKALDSVSIQTIQKWEHQMIMWMDAYRGGNSAKYAQLVVKQFSSDRYNGLKNVHMFRCF